MKSKMVLGKYVEGDTFLYKLHPMTKIILASIISIVSIVKEDFTLFGILFLVIGFALINSRVKYRDFVDSIKGLTYILLFTLVFQLIFSKEGILLYKLGFFEIYSSSLTISLLIFLRFFILITCSFLITLTTAPIELTHGLEDFFSPLKKIGVPVGDFALTISIALRFIPVFFSEAERIKNAQASKGWDLDELKYSDKIKFYGTILIPLLLSAINRAEDLANAMEIKGYSLDCEKSRFREYHFGKRDTLILLSISLLIVVTLIVI